MGVLFSVSGYNFRMKTVFKTLVDISIKMLLAGMGFGAILAFVSWTEGMNAGEWFLVGFISVASIVVLAWIIFIIVAIFFGLLDAFFRSIFGD